MMRIPTSSWLLRGILIAGLGLAMCFSAAPSTLAQGELVKEDAITRVETALRDGAEMRDLFTPVVAKARRSLVQVYNGRRRIAYGVVVGADGWIVTKASELKDDTFCKLDDGTRIPAVLAATSQQHDLALLKIESDKKLTPVSWHTQTDWRVGQWIASAGHRSSPVGVGVLSTPLRKKTGKTRGFLGVQIDDGDGGAVVTEVVKGTAAAKAGIRVGDLITSIGQKKVTGQRSLISRIGAYGPDEQVKVILRRAKETLTLQVKLGAPEAGVPRGIFGRPTSRLSRRRAEFKTWLRHDTVIRNRECGSLIVDLRGRPVGMNIARAGRTMTLALPADVMKEVSAALISEAKNKAKQKPVPSESSASKIEKDVR